MKQRLDLGRTGFHEEQKQPVYWSLLIFPANSCGSVRRENLERSARSMACMDFDGLDLLWARFSERFALLKESRFEGRLLQG